MLSIICPKTSELLITMSFRNQELSTKILNLFYVLMITSVPISKGWIRCIYRPGCCCTTFWWEFILQNWRSSTPNPLLARKGRQGPPCSLKGVLLPCYPTLNSKLKHSCKKKLKHSPVNYFFFFFSSSTRVPMHSNLSSEVYNLAATSHHKPRRMSTWSQQFPHR